MELVFFGACGSIPSGASGNVSFLVRERGWSLLVDASGNPAQSLLRAGEDPRDLDCLVLTHVHTDHLYGLPSLVHALWLMGRKKPLTVLANPETRDRARGLLSVFGLLDREGLFPLLFLFPEGGYGLPGGGNIRLHPVRHSAPTCGFRLEGRGPSLFYTADTGPLPGDFWVGKGAEILIHEASGGAGEEEALNASAHSSSRQAAEAARACGARALVLCHLPPGEAAARDLVREAEGVLGAGGALVPRPYRVYRGDDLAGAAGGRG